MIGVFDSGSGGLTVLKALVEALPDESFLYLGDHARAPYGERDNADIVAYTTEAVDFLMRSGCRLVVIACNTAASVALRTIQQNWLPAHYPRNRVLGVLVPMVEALAGVPWHREEPHEDDVLRYARVVLFGTTKTIESRAYLEEVNKRAPGCAIVQQACPNLAGMIEEGAPERVLLDVIETWVAAALDGHRGFAPDAAVLGCTHYPLVRHLFARGLPEGTHILSQPDLIAEALTDYLRRRPDFAEPGQGSVRYLTTGDPAHLRGLAVFMTVLHGQFQQVRLSDR
ncbi:glutamate racemase [Emcibacter sp. SYSU 3D8]|uniref:glutamate racemase n=1 Tax=Emcibacter sp. SYSU 3D8 TaxID=3133969 RepID=UPI0031FF2976